MMPGIGRLGGGDGESRWKNDRSPGDPKLSRVTSPFGKSIFRNKNNYNDTPLRGRLKPQFPTRPETVRSAR